MLVDTEDEEFSRTRPARRGGGGGGAFELAFGGDRDNSTGPVQASSVIGVDRSGLLVKGFALSWLCLRESGGAGGLRFCAVVLNGASSDLKYESRMSLSVDSMGLCVKGRVFGGGGRGGSGLSTSPWVPGMDRSTGDIALIVESENDSVGSSKDTV